MFEYLAGGLEASFEPERRHCRITGMRAISALRWYFGWRVVILDTPTSDLLSRHGTRVWDQGPRVKTKTLIIFIVYSALISSQASSIRYLMHTKNLKINVNRFIINLYSIFKKRHSL